MSQPEVGWADASIDAPHSLATGPWFPCHGIGGVHRRAGGVIIARTGACDQAVVVGRFFGVQFHPAMTPEPLDGWVNVGAQYLPELGIGVAERRNLTARRAPMSAARALVAALIPASTRSHLVVVLASRLFGSVRSR